MGRMQGSPLSAINVRTIERVGFLGQTGSGKTTLMRRLLDQAGAIGTVSQSSATIP